MASCAWRARIWASIALILASSEVEVGVGVGGMERAGVEGGSSSGSGRVEGGRDAGVVGRGVAGALGEGERGGTFHLGGGSKVGSTGRRWRAWSAALCSRSCVMAALRVSVYRWALKCSRRAAYWGFSSKSLSSAARLERSTAVLGVQGEERAERTILSIDFLSSSSLPCSSCITDFRSCTRWRTAR